MPPIWRFSWVPGAEITSGRASREVSGPTHFIHAVAGRALRTNRHWMRAAPRFDIPRPACDQHATMALGVRCLAHRHATLGAEQHVNATTSQPSSGNGGNGFSVRLRSAIPAMRWLRTYDRSWLRGDVVAGVTLAAYLLPAGLGDASLANVPPEAGLYACLFSGLVFWLFCSSRHTAITVTSAISLLVGASLGGIAGGDVTRFGALAAGTTLLVALIAFAAWLLKAWLHRQLHLRERDARLQVRRCARPR